VACFNYPTEILQQHLVAQECVKKKDFIMSFGTISDEQRCCQVFTMR